MKYFLVTILSITMMLSQMSISIVSHFCQGRNVNTVMSFHAPISFCNMNSVKHTGETSISTEKKQVTTTPCCENHIKKVQTDKKHIQESIHLTPVQQITLFLLAQWIYETSLEGDEYRWSQFLVLPPLLKKSRQVLFQTFLH
ncbi:hypothetical protein K5X82_02245 [Halosquirtibacter xylanolyticus]|uniref:HYC_CC_PP family protein n=1 Tax=Halosquirtibacter xylanolyticus TaxID=3374599 RepID=UPI003748FCB0|nr:hypothetical protein K5X82_02245 [Prolixibacteraceae bacterium]